jgi:hypothetical protein
MTQRLFENGNDQGHNAAQDSDVGDNDNGGGTD